jgi:hypothetical protein
MEYFKKAFPLYCAISYESVPYLKFPVLMSEKHRHWYRGPIFLHEAFKKDRSINLEYQRTGLGIYSPPPDITNCPLNDTDSIHLACVRKICTAESELYALTFRVPLDSFAACRRMYRNNLMIQQLQLLIDCFYGCIERLHKG